MFTVILGCLVSTVSSSVAAVSVFLKHCLNKVYGGAQNRVKCHCKNRVREKVVVITGANSGIGYATAQDLAKKGARVYLGCRNNQAGEKTARNLRALTGNQNIHFLHLDLADFFSVQHFVGTLLKRESQVDALVNNAGVFHHPSCLSKDGLELTYQTNFLDVVVLLTDPGNVWTGIYRHSWQAWSEIITRLKCYIFMRGTEEGAQSTIHALNTPEPVTGKYVNSFLVTEDEKSYDPTVVKSFIAASKELSGLQSLEN